jgi:hypothetical protein
MQPRILPRTALYMYIPAPRLKCHRFMCFRNIAIFVYRSVHFLNNTRRNKDNFDNLQEDSSTNLNWKITVTDHESG